MIFWSFLGTIKYSKDNFCFKESIYQWHFRLISYQSEFCHLFGDLMSHINRGYANEEIRYFLYIWTLNIMGILLSVFFLVSSLWYNTSPKHFGTTSYVLTLSLFSEMFEMMIESELKITNIPWNDNLSNPNSQLFVEMKAQLEVDMDNAFCNNSMVNRMSCEQSAMFCSIVYYFFHINQDHSTFLVISTTWFQQK